MDDASYGALLARPETRRLVAALASAWSSFGMVGLAIFLTAYHARHSSGVAGVAVAAFSLGSGAVAPLRGRLVDRRGTRPWLLLFSAFYSTCLVGLAVGVALSSTPAVLIVLAGAAGVSAPPLIASIRGLWSTVVDPDLLRRAYSLTSIVGDAALVFAPALGGVLFALAWWTPLPVAALAAVAASAIVTGQPVERRPAERPKGDARLFRSSFVVLLVVSVALGAALGLVEVATPTAATQWGETGYAGFMLGGFALGSVLGSLWFGRCAWKAEPVRRYLLATLLLAAALLPPALAGDGPTLAVLLLVAGLGYGPATISLFEMLDMSAPDRATEALTWVTTAEALGLAAGAAAAGWLATSLGVWAPFVCGSALLGGTAATALALQLRTQTLPQA
ncbi:MAG TPA: MFS transporter [Gaiellaceae bacterium]|nr:MFS transporter [Gaiellaceae bacterium]